MKKLIFIVMLGLSSIGFSGPVVEIYECQINKGKNFRRLIKYDGYVFYIFKESWFIRFFTPAFNKFL